MTSDDKVLVTKETLETAVSHMARVLQMDVPRREIKLYHPEELSDSLTKHSNSFVHLGDGYVCLPHKVEENIVFHEAAHWVLLNNGHNYSLRGELIYGGMIDEMLAILAQMTLTGSTYKPLLTKEHAIEKRGSQTHMRDRLEADHASFLRSVQEKSEEVPDEELLAQINNCKKEMKLCDMQVSACDYLYWHFTLEDGWEDAFGGNRTWEDFKFELQFFYGALSDDEPLVAGILTEAIAHRGAIAHYMYGHKPQNLVNGLLKFGEEYNQPITFTYFMFTAEMARKLFEEKEVEEWMQHPRYLTP